MADPLTLACCLGKIGEIVLGESEIAWEKAGNSADAPDLRPIAKQIVNECGCLPLALVLIGSTLSKKSGRNAIKEIWEDMLDRLTCATSTSVDERLILLVHSSIPIPSDRGGIVYSLLSSSDCLSLEGKDAMIWAGVTTPGYAEAIGTRLENLFKLPIEGCLTRQEDVHVATNNIIVFPKLEDLDLCDLPRLVGFCRGIDQIDFPQLKHLNLRGLPQFNHLFHNNCNLSSNSEQNDNVGFLSFSPQKHLELSGLENVSDLWCSELPTSSFSKLKTLNVKGFMNLRSTFHPSIVGDLANLSELVITDCSKMEGVVYWEEEIEDGQGRKVEKTLFPLLKKLQLSNLPNLVSFFPNVNVNTTTLAKSMQPQPLFNEKVAFPCLKYLGLSGLQNVSDLWGSELPTSSFSKLKNLQVTDPASLRNKVAELFYYKNHSCNGVLTLGSNGTMTMWYWPSWEVTTKVLPSGSHLVMTNDVTGVNLEEAVPCMGLSKNYYGDTFLNFYSGEKIISACGGAISLFNVNELGLEVFRTFMPPPPASTFLAFHPKDKKIIAIGMEDSTIRIYNLSERMVKSELKGHEKRITGLAFSTNLNILVSSAADAQLCIWRIDTWEHLKSVPLQLPADKACNGVTRVQFHSDRIHLLVSHETQLAIYVASKMVRIRQWVPQDVLPAQISFAVYSCDSKLVYTSFCDGNIGVFDADSLTLTCRIAPSIYLSPAVLSGSKGVEKWIKDFVHNAFHLVEEGDSSTSSAHILPEASGSESGLTLPALEEIDLDANLRVFRIGTYPQQPNLNATGDNLNDRSLNTTRDTLRDLCSRTRKERYILESNWTNQRVE
ncbi:hypothetical protein C3L33_23012, partial [Rhododendron williamsianum]